MIHWLSVLVEEDDVCISDLSHTDNGIDLQGDLSGLKIYVLYSDCQQRHEQSKTPDSFKLVVLFYLNVLQGYKKVCFTTLTQYFSHCKKNNS